MSFETQNQVYSLIKKFQIENKRTPTVRWIAEKLGFKSTRSAKQYLDRLAESGRIVRDSTGKICFMTPPGLPILSTISAGYATAEEQDVENYINFEEYLCGSKTDLFLLKVRGDSMQDAGIVEGDLVLVDKNKNPIVGDIVVGYIDGGWTLKRLEKKDGKYYLKAENPKYPEFIPKENLEVGGVVISVVRKY